MSEIGVNAQFLNKYFGAKPAKIPESNLIAVASPMAERKDMVGDYLREKFPQISKLVSEGKVDLSEKNKKQMDRVREEFDVFALIGGGLNFADAPFKDLFNDFATDFLPKVADWKKAAAQAGSPQMTPLDKMLRAGVSSAVHIWEAVLKSVIKKLGPKIAVEQFKQAYEKSKDLLMDLTDIPLQVLSSFEHYILNREKSYADFNIDDQEKEKQGSNVRHEAISYDAKTGAVNLNQEFMSTDQVLEEEKAKLIRAIGDDESLLEYRGCFAKQVIPLMFDYMDQIFAEQVFPHFDAMVKKTKFEK